MDGLSSWMVFVVTFITMMNVMFQKICLLVWMDGWMRILSSCDSPQKWNKSDRRYFWHYFASTLPLTPFEVSLSSVEILFTRNLMPCSLSLFLTHSRLESMYSNKSRRIFLWSKLMPSCPMCSFDAVTFNSWRRDNRMFVPGWMRRKFMIFVSLF